MTQLENGWCRVTLDIQNAAIEDEVRGVTKDFIKIMRLSFSNQSAVAESESAIYLDNLTVTDWVKTSVELNEEKPWETKSPYVNYVVTFENADGSIISQTTYHYGDTVVVPEAPTRASSPLEGTFAFTGWSAEIQQTVTGSATYRAIYDVSLVDFINGTVSEKTVDALAYDTNVKNGSSEHSLKVTGQWNKAGDQFPYFAITLDKDYDLTNQYMVFDLYKNNYNSWFALDFVNDGTKIGVWNAVSFNADTNEATHYSEEIGGGWLRVYVNVAAMMNGADVSKVSKLYFTVNNGNEGVTGNLEFYVDNLHFTATPMHTVTFKDYDGTVISSVEYALGATVNVPENPTRAEVVGECSYVFAGWDYAVTDVQRTTTYTATYQLASIADLINASVAKETMDAVGYDAGVKSADSTHSLKVTGQWNKAGDQFPYFVIALDKDYDLNNQYMVFDLYKNNYSSWFAVDFVNDGTKIGVWKSVSFNVDTKESTHFCEDLGEGWLRVYVDAAAMMDGNDLSKVSKLYFTVNNGNEGVTGNLEFYVDNLHFEEKPEVVLPTEADDSIGGCGFVAVNGGTASLDTGVVSSCSEKSVKFSVPAGNSGVWWNYDVDLTKLMDSGLDLSGKTITFDVKLVGNMTWVGFTVADGNGAYATPNGESYAWTNLSNGWSGYGISVAAMENGWFRVTLNVDTSFSGQSGNLAKLRFLVNPQDANEAAMYVDNLYLGELKAYQEPVRTEADDALGACGLVAVNGGTMVADAAVVSTNSTASVKCTVPAGNSGVWWNYDVSLKEIAGGACNLSGKTITFDVKIVGNMSLVGFTVADANDTYAQPDGESYVWTNLTDGWGADKGWVVTALENGWFRVSFTADTKFSSQSSNIAKLRFLVNPQDGNEAALYIDNLYLA